MPLSPSGGMKMGPVPGNFFSSFGGNGALGSFPLVPDFLVNLFLLFFEVMSGVDGSAAPEDPAYDQIEHFLVGKLSITLFLSRRPNHRGVSVLQCGADFTGVFF